MLYYSLACSSEPPILSLQPSGEPRSSLLRPLHPESDREDITWFHRLHQWLVERPHEGKRVRCCLWHTFPLKESVLAQVDGLFHLPWWKVEPNRDRQVITGQ